MKTPLRPRLLAFTLVELLAVLAILAVLLALVVPAAGTIMRGQEMNRAGALLMDQIQQTRQYANTQARPAELRFYEAARENPDTRLYQGLQIFVLDERGENAAPAGPVMWLPETTALHPAADYSPLLSAALYVGTHTLPSGVACNYRALRFQPSGAPALPAAGAFLTAVPAAELTRGRPPGNFACVKVHPVTGRPVLYRP
jgi:uncharacterized protein (TIGR02596 family)